MIERQRGNRTAGPDSVVAYAGAAAFVIATAWFWLAAKGLTVVPASRTWPDLAAQHGPRIYDRWQATTLTQEQYYTSLAIAGFLALALAAGSVRDLLGCNRLPARVGSSLAGAGAFLGITGSILQLGAHRAVGLMATHANPIQTTKSIPSTIDAISQALALAAAAGGIGTADGSATRSLPRWRCWPPPVQCRRQRQPLEQAVLASGTVLLPVWLIWASRIDGTGHPARHAP